MGLKTNVFEKSVTQQAEAMSNILGSAQNKFVLVKTFSIKQDDQQWVDSYTRLSMRKNERNYHIFKES